MMTKIKNALTRKLGPLPAWAWIAIGGVALWYYRRRTSSTSTGTGTIANTPPTPQSPVTLGPGESVYDPNTGDLLSTPGGDSGGTDTSGDMASAIQSLATAIQAALTGGNTPTPSGTGGTHTSSTKRKVKVKPHRGKLTKGKTRTKPHKTHKSKPRSKSTVKINSGHGHNAVGGSLGAFKSPARKRAAKHSPTPRRTHQRPTAKVVSRPTVRAHPPSPVARPVAQPVTHSKPRAAAAPKPAPRRVAPSKPRPAPRKRK